MIELILLDASTIHAPLANPESVLSKPELQRFEMMRSDARRREFLIGRILLKAVLTQWNKGCTRDFTKISPTLSATGKPTLPGVEFNLSHDGDVVLLAVGDQPVGVDVESVQNFDAAMMDICFTDEEREHISCSDETDRTATLLWCMKEAAAKATGSGLLSGVGRANPSGYFFASGFLNTAGRQQAYAVCSPREISANGTASGLPGFGRVFAEFQSQHATRRGAVCFDTQQHQVSADGNIKLVASDVSLRLTPFQ